ncbi:4550_t:CDS:2, partial [Scutellospora calospora]
RTSHNEPGIDNLHDAQSLPEKDNKFEKNQTPGTLWSQLKNTLIKYEASIMNKQVWKLLSPHAKKSNKILSQLAYKHLLFYNLLIICSEQFIAPN